MNLTRQEINNLRDKTFRKREGLFLVEGKKFCKDILSHGVDIVYTLTSNDALTGYPNICILPERTISLIATTKTSQNIICVCRVKTFDFASTGDSLILDNLQDPGNVGTLIRSAVAFGFNDIYLINCADAYSEKVIRSSAGMVFFARIHPCKLSEILENKAKIAKKYLVADMFGTTINEIRLPKEKIAVIIGNEGQGVCQELKTAAEIKISIPMNAKVESLNAGVAGSIIMQKISEVRNVRA